MTFSPARRPLPFLVPGLLVLLSLWGRAEEAPYHEPNLSVPLFAADQITLPPLDRAQAAEWLADVPCLDSRRVTPRLCTMSLTLALHLEPRHRAALIVNHWLRRGLPPRRSETGATKDQVVEGLRSITMKLSDSPDDQLLLALTTDILRALSPEDIDPDSPWSDRGTDDPWRGTIPPASLEIPVQEAGTFYLASGGEVLSLTLRGSAKYAHSKPKLVVGKQAVRGIFEPGSFAYDALHAKHPFVAEHLELTLSIKKALSGSARELPPEELALPVALLTNLFFIPDASAETLLITGRLDARGSVEAPPDLLTRMNHLDLRRMNEKKRRIRGIVLPRTPPLYWRDWLIFHRMDKVLACDLFAAGHLAEIQAICDNDESLQQRRHLIDQIRRQLLNLPHRRDGRQVFSALQQSPVLREQLGVLARGTPQLLSAQLLLDYVHLPPRLRASLSASADYLRSAAEPFLGKSLQDLSGSSAHKLCTETMDDILLQSGRLHIDSLSLATDLSKIIDQSILPYTRIRHKKTESAKRQLAEVIAEFEDWEARLDRLGP